jgi:hypothetical protein
LVFRNVEDHSDLGGFIHPPDLARLMKEVQDDAATMIRAVSAGKASDADAANGRLAAIRTATDCSEEITALG